MMIVSVMIHDGKVKLMGPPPKMTLLDLSILPRAGACGQASRAAGRTQPNIHDDSAGTILSTV